MHQHLVLRSTDPLRDRVGVNRDVVRPEERGHVTDLHDGIGADVDDRVAGTHGADHPMEPAANEDFRPLDRGGRIAVDVPQRSKSGACYFPTRVRRNDARHDLS